MTVQRQFSISASREVVWLVLRDLERWPTWTPSVTSVQPLDDARFEAGARFRVRQPALPTATYEITDIYECTRFCWVASSPGMRLVADHRLEEAPVGCKVTLSFATQGPLGALFGLLFSRKIGKMVELEAKSLKRRCEARETTPIR